MTHFPWLVLLVWLGGVLCVDRRVGEPRLDLVRSQDGYHGLVRENETKVEVWPAIRAVGAPICGFRIVNKRHGDVPFEIRLLADSDSDTGKAEIVARRKLNCNKRKNYRFDISAVSCGHTEKLSPNVTVRIAVDDVNEYSPVFDKPSYVVQVDEGRLYDQIVRLRAVDGDCSPKFGDVCKYEIQTSGQPFIIDDEGTIKNTEPLDYGQSHNHILFVKAYDCGMKASDQVTVTIKVNRVCQLGWKDMPAYVEYTPNSGEHQLFPDASLDLCDVPCSLEKVQTRVTLSTKHIGKGCDRDTYNVENQRRLCGASDASIDLLPGPRSGQEWTRGLLTDHGLESDRMFEFDGVSKAVVVPSSVTNHDLTHQFTLAYWMKHSRDVSQDAHSKEHILCNADDHQMNRHHYALFVRNCRLIFLLRRSPHNDMDTFKPAEWRWKIPQVCDNEWHHYAVSMVFPSLELYIDGQLFTATGKNPDVIDDSPLRKTRGIVNTTLTVGACWQGSDSTMKHYFRGYLAGLSLLRGRNEDPTVLACLHQCKESLRPPPMVLLEPGMELLSNNDLTEVTIDGDNHTNMEALMRKVSYINSREFPTPGHRGLKITTNVVCSNGRSVKIPPVVDTFVMVQPPLSLTIQLSGTTEFGGDYDTFRAGLPVFPDLELTVRTDQEQSVDDSKLKLDECSVSVYPPLNPGHEAISLPLNLMSRLGLQQRTNKDGVIVEGPAQAQSYQEVLRLIRYTNREPAYYLNRAFKVICSEMSGRFVSNEYEETLTVLHPQMVHHTEKPAPAPEAPKHDHDTPVQAHAQIHHHAVEFRPASKSFLTSNLVESGGEGLAVGGAGHAVTIIVVVCVGFLLFMVVLGVIRIRAAHRRSQQEEIADTEMAWDDSSLNITVNPMEHMEMQEQSPCGADDYDDDSSDDGSYDDSSDDDDEVTQKEKDLEWDNSTLQI